MADQENPQAQRHSRARRPVSRRPAPAFVRRPAEAVAARREGGPGGGPGGGPRKGKRQFFRKRKVCRFCVDKVDFIDYKKADMLNAFVQDRGKILPRRMTGTCSRHQRWLCEAIKRARNIALMSFASEL